MAFDREFKQYKENNDLEYKFLEDSDSILHEYELIDAYLNQDEPCDIEYGLINMETTYDYSTDEDFIYHMRVVDFGVFLLDELEDYTDYQKLVDNNEHPLESSFNDIKVEMKNYDYDNVEKEIEFNLYYQGERNEIEIMNSHGFKIVISKSIKNNNIEFYLSLILDAIELKDDKRYDLGFFLFFSAIDSYVNLLIEDIQNIYYSEIGLKGLEFKLKLSLALKENIGVEKDKENFEVKDLIVKKYKEIYDLRNKVAHGQQRTITLDDCNKCFELFVLIYYAVKYKTATNAELLKSIKK